MNIAPERVLTVLDLETTGLDPHDNQIIEIFARRVWLDDRNNITGYDDFHRFVRLNEGQARDDFNRKLTNISDEILAEQGIDEKEAIRELAKFVGYTTVVAQYAPFDLGFLFIRGNLLFKKFIDTRTMSKIAEPTESASLSKVCARHGIVREVEHRAEADVIDTIKVFQIQEPVMREKGFDYLNVAASFADRPLDAEFVAAYQGIARFMDLAKE